MGVFVAKPTYGMHFGADQTQFYVRGVGGLSKYDSILFVLSCILHCDPLFSGHQWDLIILSNIIIVRCPYIYMYMYIHLQLFPLTIRFLTLCRP